MSERLSTGLRDWMLGYGSMREAFKDCVMKIYSGTAPASADDEKTGVLLVTITKSSGAVTGPYWNDGAMGERSTYNTWKIVLDGDNGLGDECKINIDLNGDGGTTYIYKNTPDAGDADAVRLKVVEMLNDLGYLKAVPADSADNEIYVRTTVPGDVLIITDDGGAITIVPTETDEEGREDTLWFGLPDGGAMPKSSDTWSGVIATSGVAGYFRIVRSDDDGTLSTTQVRAQGAVATSGAELNLSSTSLVAGTTLTIDNYSISLPAE
jgi:hypothetical protein